MSRLRRVGESNPAGLFSPPWLATKLCALQLTLQVTGPKGIEPSYAW